ncbi:hypothetical protein CN507_17805 [Bacillus cereus]|nr:hypothetical protein CN507_17805 [Bacillus cereus]
MNLTPVKDIVTVNDIRAIESYIKLKEISHGQALRILKFNLFNVQENTTGIHYLFSEEIEEIYNYYQNTYPKHFEKRNISCFDDLIVKAFSYCERYSHEFKEPIYRYSN